MLKVAEVRAIVTNPPDADFKKVRELATVKESAIDAGILAAAKIGETGYSSHDPLKGVAPGEWGVATGKFDPTTGEPIFIKLNKAEVNLLEKLMADDYAANGFTVGRDANDTFSYNSATLDLDISW